MTTSPANTLKAFTDAARDSLKRVVAGFHQEAKRERELHDAHLRATLAELRAQLASMKEAEAAIRAAWDAMPRPRDGVDGRDGKDGVSPSAEEIVGLIRADAEKIAADVARSTVAAWERPADGKDGANGKDADPELIRAMVAEAVAEIPVPKDGKDGRDGLDGKDGRDGIDGKDGDRGLDGAPGKLPKIREYADGVYYEGDVVTRDGAIYQAERDTGKAPGHEDWRCIVARGEPGPEGPALIPRGTYSADEFYARSEFVMIGGSSFVAKKDNPGPCPGDGWQLLASGGSKGKPGEPGRPGNAGPALRAVEVDGEGRLMFTNADGTRVDCDLYPLLAKIGQ